ncbi:MAG: hypothetical protein HRT94_07990 [Alphaproteobacteria bacterium]|nr:hypothetical protein [Alphaproteobacteria bacterium]
MSKPIEQAIDLIKKFALATKEEKTQHLAQLTLVEHYMSVKEQCQYAFELNARLQGCSVDDVEEQFGFSPIQLELMPLENRQKLIVTGKSALIFHFMGEATKSAARAALIAIGDTPIDDDDRALLNALAMTNKPPKPGALLN